MHLTHLNHLTLLNMSPGSIGIPALSVARDLLVLPSLHTLVIDAGFPSCFTLFSGSGNAEPPAEEPCPQTEITGLRLLRSSPEVSAWFLDPQCPTRTSQLQHVEFYEAASPAPIKVLEAVPGIEVVHLHARVYLLYLFSHNANPNFTDDVTLRLIGHPHEIKAALASLPRVIDRLQMLVLASQRHVNAFPCTPHGHAQTDRHAVGRAASSRPGTSGKSKVAP
ncbi:hypothetical protein C8R44DRAFT_873410 [Mycena epipterygia]|nr:hypothetical protein C8R44DRAFT_873410 [Mycena epipterygia]